MYTICYSHFLQAEGQNFEVETKAYTKLRFSSSIAFTKTCSSTKTCSFRTYLEQLGSILRFCASVSVSRRLILSPRHLHLECQTYIEPESFSFCFSFSSMITSHFDFKWFITKTSFRRSSDEKLYISSFGTSLASTTSSRKDICHRASFIWTGFAIMTFHSEVRRK